MPGGALGLMLYGRYGRTGVYQVQALMRLVNGGEADPRERIANTKAMLADLPATNWFKRGEELFSDHVRFGDVGVYDLFLHEQDRAYSVLLEEEQALEQTRRKLHRLEAEMLKRLVQMGRE